MLAPAVLCVAVMELRFDWAKAGNPGPLADAVARVMQMPRVQLVRSAWLPELHVFGAHRGVPVIVRFTYGRSSRHGYRPATEVIVVGSTMGAHIYLGGAHVGHPDYERPVAFPDSALSDVRLLGTPQRLVERIAHGPVGARMAHIKRSAEGSVTEVLTGYFAQRRDVRPDGVFMRFRGWPGDDQTLAFLLDTVVEAMGTIHASVPELAGPRGTFEGHPEVVAYMQGMERSRAKGLVVVAGILSALAVVSALMTALIVWSFL